MKIVTLIPDPFNLSAYESHAVDDIREFLRQRYAKFPATARIYHKSIAQSCDVTPTDEASVEKLGTLEGPFYVVVYPGEPLTIVLVVVAVLAVAAAFLLRPKVSLPSSAVRNTQNSSPNNELSDRTNKARVNGRICDIYGTVRSTPDLLITPYKVFIGHVEVEYAYMCIGRGAYDVSSIRDDTTPIAAISGSTVEIFSPFTSPNSDDEPQLRVGSAITEPIYHTKRSNSVDGQVLRPPNANKVIGANNIRFVYPDEIQLIAESQIDFTDFFVPGDNIVLDRATYGGTFVNVNHSVYASIDAGVGTLRFTDFDPTTLGDLEHLVISNALFSIFNGLSEQIDSVELSGTFTISSLTSDSILLDNPQEQNPQWAQLGLYNETDPYEAGPRTITFENGEIADPIFDLAGTYEALSVTDDTITLASPTLVNDDWEIIAEFPDSESPYISARLVTTGDKWIGPFVLDLTTTTNIFANFVATNGLYKDNGNNQIKMSVDVELEVTPIDGSGAPIGAAELFEATIEGSAVTRNTRAITMNAALSFVGASSVRARRITETDLDFAGSVIDEIKWRDLMSANLAPENDYGNVTTVHSVTFATSGALSVKERKLNMLVTRKLPQRVSGSTFTEELFPTNNAADILSAVCLDPFIGNRQISEVDFDSIYDTVEEIEDYFGIVEATEFSYTFDSDNLSFEETVVMIATAIFCTAYRRGNIIKLSFEKETDDSTLLFNHRNKLPGSETRTVRFGTQKDNDGVEYEYVDPVDDSIVTFYLPVDRSSVNPEKIESTGVRSIEQAHLHAWRLWNKIRYQNLGVEFVATQEADLIVLQDRILNADNTRADTQDGEIVAQFGLVLTLSQNVALDDPEGHTIFVQHIDGTVQSIAVSAGADAKHVTLGEAPTLPLAVADELYARATYMIVGNTDNRPTAFLVTEKKIESNFTFSLTAVNYDARYYQNDKDFA